MDEPREAIFITEVLQDGRATNIMAMLTGSLVIATAVFSLLAAQAWARSRSRAQTFASGSAWATALEWQVSGDLAVKADGSVEFGPSAGSLDVPLARPTSRIGLELTNMDSTVNLSRLSLMMLGEASQPVNLVFAASGAELWLGHEASEGRLLAWSSEPCSVQGIGSVELSLSDGSLQVLCGETVRLAHPEAPLGSVTYIRLQVEPGPAFSAELSIR